METKQIAFQKLIFDEKGVGGNEFIAFIKIRLWRIS